MTRTERFCRQVACWLPDRVVEWCFVLVVLHATTGAYSNQIVPELTAMDALKRWIDKRKG